MHVLAIDSVQDHVVHQRRRTTQWHGHGRSLGTEDVKTHRYYSNALSFLVCIYFV